MGTSNGRFLLGLLLGALLGGVLGHFLTGASKTPTLPSAGLSPGQDNSPVATASAAHELPASVSSHGREVARAQPASMPVAQVTDAEVQQLMAGLVQSAVARSSGNGSISGRVLDAEGKPLQHVVLRLRADILGTPGTKTSAVGAPAPATDSLEETVRRAAEGYQQSRANLLELETDASGSYRFTQLADSKWSVSAFLAGYMIKPDASPRSLPVGSTVDFTGTKVIEVPTAVLAAGGASAKTASIHAKLTTGSRASRTSTYSWSPEAAYLRLTPGEYEVTAYSPYSGSVKSAEFASESQKIIVEAGAPVPSLLFELRGRPGIAGHVYPAKGDPPGDLLRVHLMSLAPGQEVDLAQLAQSDETSYSRQGSEYTFPDLAPGRYVVGAARSWNSPIIQHRIVDVAQAKVICDLNLPAMDLSQMLRITVLGSSGEHLSDVQFNLTVSRPRGTRSSGISSLRDTDGSYLLEFAANDHKVYFGDEEPDTKFKIDVTQKDYGSKSIELTRGQTEVSLTFVTPGTLEVTVAGYQGSGYEGRLGISAKLKTDNKPWGFLSSSRGKKMSPEGVQKIENLTPGSYSVSLSASPKGSGDNLFQSNVLESMEVEVLEGQNTLLMQIPTLYALRVHAVDAKEGANISAARLGDDNGFGGGHNASFDANGYADLEDMRPGDYVLRGPSGQMNVTVPGGEVEFEAMKLNALRVTIYDTDGDLTKLGFRSGDLVIGQDGEPFKEEPDFSLLGKLLSSKSSDVNFLVLRGGKRLEIAVKGSEVGDWQTMGGSMSPAAY